MDKNIGEYLDAVDRSTNSKCSQAVDELCDRLGGLSILNAFILNTLSEKGPVFNTNTVWLFTKTDIIEYQFSQNKNICKFIPINRISNITLEFDETNFSISFDWANEKFVLQAVGRFNVRHLVSICNNIINKKNDE